MIKNIMKPTPPVPKKKITKILQKSRLCISRKNFEGKFCGNHDFSYRKGISENSAKITTFVDQKLFLIFGQKL